MTDTISLHGLREFGYHGVFDFEKEQGQEFIVDVDIQTNFAAAVASDNIEKTVNYADVAAIAVEGIKEQRFDLIESLADHIAQRVLKLDGVIAVEVTVHKPQAPIQAEFADVRVTRRLS
jgi:dihydroneopterin aldolase